jgi:hypothetical protein
VRLALVGMLALVGCGDPLPGQMDPPPEGEGFQYKIEDFPVNAGTETQRCYFVEIPGTRDADVWVNEIRMSQTDGSHHMNILRVKTVVKLDGVVGGPPVVDGECFKSPNWADWPLVANTQLDGKLDWKLPAGVAHRFKGGEKIMLQTHYVNATTQKTPESGRVAVNFYFSKDTAPQELGTLFATNQNIKICPGDVGKSFTKTCRFPSAGVNVIAANGHFHSRGKLFEMFAVDAQGTVGEKFYTSTAWDEPPMSRDFTTVLPAGAGVQWKCTFDFPQGTCGNDTAGNPNPDCCYTFGPKVDGNEHCNAFVYYYPKTVDVNCF